MKTSRILLITGIVVVAYLLSPPIIFAVLLELPDAWTDRVPVFDYYDVYMTPSVSFGRCFPFYYEVLKFESKLLGLI